jgi:hypothetical protein
MIFGFNQRKGVYGDGIITKELLYYFFHYRKVHTPCQGERGAVVLCLVTDTVCQY